ncbi:hypothetical protein Q7P37_009515 [Cladosporium fusiforme]
MADDEWTFVPRKKQGKSQSKPQTVTVHHEPRSMKDATVSDIEKDFAAKLRTWRQSTARQQLHRTLLHLKPDAGWQIHTAVCLGTGSFSRDNFDCRKRTMEQFAMFADTVEYLQKSGECEIDVHVQEGWYNDLDKEFLRTKGMKVPEMQQGAYPTADCGPATELFGPHTFVCELYIEHSEGTIRSLTQRDVPLLVSTSRRMCSRDYYPGGVFKKGDLTAFLGAMDKNYRSLRFPHFDEDPNVFEGLDVLAPLPEDEDDD